MGHYTTEGIVQQWYTILQKVQYNSWTLYYRRYSTIVGHYTTEGTLQQCDTILQKVQYNSGTLYYRRYSTTVGHYTTEDIVQLHKYYINIIRTVTLKIRYNF